MTDNTTAGTREPWPAPIIQAAQQAIKPVPVAPGQIFLVRDEDDRPIIIDTYDYTDKPRQITRSAFAYDTDSFLDHITRAVDALGDGYEHCEIWADQEHDQVVAVLDGLGLRGTNRVYLRLKKSPEWGDWVTRSGVLFDQEDFADFFEDHLSQIVDPPGATLLEIAQSVRGTQKATFGAVRMLQNGSMAAEWAQEATAKAGAKGQLEIPAEFALGLRPYLGADPFKVTARLRWRVGQDGLRLGYKLDEPERRLEAAFDQVIAAIDGALPVRVNRGIY